MSQDELFPGETVMIHPAIERAVAAVAREHSMAAAYQAQVTAAEKREVASVFKAEFLDKISVPWYPNFSSIIRYRSDGQGIGFYETMLGTDPDLRGLFQDIIDDLLHTQNVVWPADDRVPAYNLHARFIRYAFSMIPHFQNAVDHALASHARGFAVLEKVYTVVERGEWSGAVIYADLMDTQQRWWNFGIDRELLFKTLQNPMPGEPVPPEKFMVVTHGSNSNPWGHAVLDDCYWAWYLKHFAMKSQAIFFEKWAQPTPKAVYKHSSNEKVNDLRIESAIKAITAFQTDSGVAIPDDITIDLIESLRQGAVSYEAYVNQLTEMESRAVTGQILTMFGAKGGSYALGKVHEKRVTNKVQKLSAFINSQFSRQLIRDLIDRNFGPQDMYPRFEYLSMEPLQKQAHAEVQKALQQNGHEFSKKASMRFFQIVPPEDPSDLLTPPPEAAGAQTLPVNPTLAAPAANASVLLAGSGYVNLKTSVGVAAGAHRAKLDGIAKSTTKDAKPAIRRAIKVVAGPIRKAKSVKKVKKADLHRAVRGADFSHLGQVMSRIMNAPADIAPPVAMAGEGPPPPISNAAKAALALQVYEIVEQVYGAAQDAPDGMDPATFVDSLTDPAGLALDERMTGTFAATHPTNIATVATAQLRANLADPAFRKAHPYVIITVTNPTARLGHQLMNGFVMTAEEALYSPFLPPFDFGCDCVAVAITAEQARAAGFTGAAPTGTLEEFLAAQGVKNGRLPGGGPINVGPAPGFRPAYAATDLHVQLDALRAKAQELLGEDPEAYGALLLWVIWLFGVNVLLEDPPPDEAV